MTQITPDEIKRLRATLSMSQPEFAKACTCTRDTVASWETGRRVPSSTHLIEIRRLQRKVAQALAKGKIDSLIKPSDSWNFFPLRYPARQPGHGYIPGDIYANCFWYYAKPDSLVIDAMAGSGMAAAVYEDRGAWMGSYKFDFDLCLFDLTPRVDGVKGHDLIKSFPMKTADYIIMDVPYFGMAKGQYSKKPNDLANMDWSDWEAAMRKIATNCAAAQQTDARCTVISPNHRDVKTGAIQPVTWAIKQWWTLAGYVLYDVAYSSRRIQQEQSQHMAIMNGMAKRQRVMLTEITEVMTFVKNGHATFGTGRSD